MKDENDDDDASGCLGCMFVLMLILLFMSGVLVCFKILKLAWNWL